MAGVLSWGLEIKPSMTVLNVVIAFIVSHFFFLYRRRMGGRWWLVW